MSDFDLGVQAALIDAHDPALGRTAATLAAATSKTDSEFCDGYRYGISSALFGSWD